MPLNYNLSAILHAHGVRDVVVSPGSRNAPLIAALHRSGLFRIQVIVDERSAAFVALGICSHRRRPVAVVCTSGSAVLNCAPATAEAYYRGLPLIIISADRPVELIDQADSQTIRQCGVLANFVKRSYNLPDDPRPHTRMMIERDLNDALITATSGFYGPVHVNVELRAPLFDGNGDEFNQPKIIKRVEAGVLVPDKSEQLYDDLMGAQDVMVVCGHRWPDARLRGALAALCNSRPNVTVVAEPVSNLWQEGFLTELQSVAGAPSLLISLGGSLVSATTKRLLREHTPKAHWHIGQEDCTVDTFSALTLHIQQDPTEFFSRYASYSADSELPEGINLQLSNGMSVRCAFTANLAPYRRIDGNRGVSGIDGSTSTAIGLAIADGAHTTLLVSGDMSCAYDVAAFAIRDIPANFKMAVVNNHGGEIFRRVATTRDLPELRDYIDVEPRLPLRELADAYGFAYFSAPLRGNPCEISSLPAAFLREAERPAILELIAD